MLAGALLTLVALADTTGRVYDGRRGELAVAIPRLEQVVAIDGLLDEPAWRQAAVLAGFSRYAPSDGMVAENQTEVLVWFSPTAIHFGIRAHARPGTFSSATGVR